MASRTIAAYSKPGKAEVAAAHNSGYQAGRPSGRDSCLCYHATMYDSTSLLACQLGPLMTHTVSTKKRSRANWLIGYRLCRVDLFLSRVYLGWSTW